MQAQAGGDPRELAKGITTRFRKTVWKRFLSAMQRYEMTQKGDKIAVCISGGKDSFLLALCLQLLRKHSDIPFDLCFLALDPGYDADHLQALSWTAQRLGLPLDVCGADIFRVIDAGVSSPCHVCASMRRGHLYKAAMERGCNKIALGHHFDDVVETILLSLLYGGEFKTMLPRLKSMNYPGMELIRPLYFVRERAILTWQEAYRLPALPCACRVMREGGGKRREMKELLFMLEKSNPHVATSIFRSTCAVNVSTLLGWRAEAGTAVHSFMDGFRPLQEADVHAWTASQEDGDSVVCLQGGD